MVQPPCGIMSLSQSANCFRGTVKIRLVPFLLVGTRAAHFFCALVCKRFLCGERTVE